MGNHNRMSQRFFRTSDPFLYESVRLQLDAAWGHPTPDGLTVTCIDPVDIAPRDADGNILLAVNPEFVEYEPAATLLPQLLLSGGVEEITRAQYLPVPPE